MRILGVDFTSTPKRGKPISAAWGELVDARTLRVDTFLPVSSLDSFQDLVETQGPWVGGFDFPFSLPRELVETLGWPLVWEDLVTHCETLSRKELTAAFDAFRAPRPAGKRYASREIEKYCPGASPSMRCHNPPVAWMFHVGTPRLLAAKTHIPGIHTGDTTRVALEAYPGVLARSICKEPYKSDDKKKQDEKRASSREKIIQALVSGDNPLKLRVLASTGLLAAMQTDASGDTLDSVLCQMQAAWGAVRASQNYGLPLNFDPLEGWIVSVERDA
jgi:hypothetical protein